MAEQNLIPSLNASGRFEASAPFDVVVDPTKYYTVEALRTIREMEGLKLNLYELIFKPIGVQEADFKTVLDRARGAGAIVVCLLDRAGVETYVLSTYLTSFPLTNGVSYERMCLIADLGACPPSMKDTIAQVQTHMQQYIMDTIGINSKVDLGTIPTIGYVSADQAAAYETTRKNNITNSTNDVAKIRDLTQQLADRDTYIASLEAKVIELQP